MRSMVHLSATFSSQAKSFALWSGAVCSDFRTHGYRSARHTGLTSSSWVGAIGALSVALMIALAPTPMRAQIWRVWTDADGLADSYCNSIQQDHDGSMWVGHGIGSQVTTLDGYRAQTVPLPGDADEVFAVGFGTRWVLSPQGIYRRGRDGWIFHYLDSVAGLPPDERLMIRLLPLSKSRLAALLPDRLLVIDSESGSVDQLLEVGDRWFNNCRTIDAAADRTLWLGCELAILGVRSSEPNVGRPGRTQAVRLPCGVRNVRDLSVEASGDLLAVAESRQNKDLVGLRLAGRRWSRIWKTAESDLTLRSGEGATVFVRDGSRIFQLSNAGPVEIPGPPEQAGDINDILIGEDNDLWVATARGLKRYSESIWTRPDHSIPAETVHAAAEDGDGGLWFSARRSLLHFRGDSWRTVALPLGQMSYTLHTNAIARVGKGLLALKTTRPDRLLLFDPDRSRFTSITHPSGRLFRMIAPRSDASIWVNTTSRTDRFDQRLEIFDGKSFVTVLDVNDDWEIGRMRTLFTDSDGAIWIGGTTGVARVSGETYDAWSDRDSGEPEGAYAILRTRDGRLLVGGRNRIRQFKDGSWREVARLGKIRSFAEDASGRLWAAGEHGVFCWLNDRFIQHDVSEGLPATESYLAFVDREKRLWVGTDRGVVSYTPENDAYAPLISLPLSEEVPVFSPRSPVLVSFSGLDKWKLTSTRRLLYKYSLDGGKWSAWDRSGKAQWANLSSGRHALRVRVTDRAGNVTELNEPLMFDVDSAWYWKPPALGMLALTFLAIPVLLGAAVHAFVGKTRVIRQLQTANAQAVAAQSAIEEVVKVKTEELRIANVSLEESKRKAENASRLKSEFVATMSHEVRSPLTVILGLTELLLEGAPQGEDRVKLETVREACDDLQVIVNDILDLSKIEAGQVDLEDQSYRPADVARIVVERLAPEGRRKGLSISWQSDQASAMESFGDPRRLRQALANLVNNSIKFTERGWVRVGVEARPALGGFIRFCVEDSGIGIPEEALHRIFGSFVQADGSTGRRYGGTGLGLTISRKLAELMGGRLSVESAEGEGSAFALEVPYKPVPRELRQTPQNSPVTQSPRRSRLRVAVVDDRPATLDLVRELLERMGHEVTSISSGATAVKLVEHDGADVVLMDVQMPGMDGLETTRRIRASEAGTGRRTPIIAVTADAMWGDRERYLREGMDDYVSKPLDRTELGAALERVQIDRRPSTNCAEGSTRQRETGAQLDSQEGNLCG